MTSWPENTSSSSSLTESPAVSRPRTSQDGRAASSAAPVQPLVVFSPGKRLTATASISCLVKTPMQSRTSAAILEEPRTFPIDSISTTARRNGGTGHSSSAVEMIPSTKDTGDTLSPASSKSPQPPNIAPYRITIKPRDPENYRRLNSLMSRPSLSSFVASFLSLESTLSMRLTGTLRHKHLHRTSTPRFSRSLPPIAALMPELVSSEASSSC